MIGTKLDDKNVSVYQPPLEVAEFSAKVKEDYATGMEILQKTYTELNDMDVVGRMNKDQKVFNSYVDESVEDPAEAWKWRGTRSQAAKKARTMHAHLTSSFIVPNVFAQNESQEEDQEASDVMRSLIEWMTINSPYRSVFLMATQGMLVNPVTYIEADFCEVYQKIKEKTDKGYKKKEILDEVLSGFQPKVLSANQVLISNAYEQNIQRQRFIIKRRFIDYTEAKGRYKDHENWVYLQPGVKTYYDDADHLFYDIKDEDHPTLIEEITYLNRLDDVEVCFLNGIYFGESNVEGNRIRHRDNFDAPKYNIVPFGYERINEHFFFYKSLINKVGWDNTLIDAMYEMTMNREFLDLFPPVSITGEDKIDTQVIFPGAQISSQHADTKVSAIMPPRSGNSYAALANISNSINENSVSETQGGNLPSSEQKATAIVDAARNAKIVLAGALKTLSESVSQLGALMVDIVINNLTTAEIDEITGNMKYKQFILKDQVGETSKKIKFDKGLLGKGMTKGEIEAYSFKMFDGSGYPEKKNTIYSINPEMFAKLKYLIRIEPDEMLPMNREFQQMMAERLYTLLRQDPLIDPEFLLRKLLNMWVRGETDKAIVKQQAPQIMGQGALPQGQQNLPALPNTPQMAMA